MVGVSCALSYTMMFVYGLDNTILREFNVLMILASVLVDFTWVKWGGARGGED